jgi:hypothetical protein
VARRADGPDARRLPGTAQREVEEGSRDDPVAVLLPPGPLRPVHWREEARREAGRAVLGARARRGLGQRGGRRVATVVRPRQGDGRAPREPPPPAIRDPRGRALRLPERVRAPVQAGLRGPPTVATTGRGSTITRASCASCT